MKHNILIVITIFVLHFPAATLSHILYYLHFEAGNQLLFFLSLHKPLLLQMAHFGVGGISYETYEARWGTGITHQLY